MDEWWLAFHSWAGCSKRAVIRLGGVPGRRAISASWDKTLRVWDLESGRAIASFCGESPIDTCIAGRDGLTFIAGERTGRVHFLRLEGAQ